MKKIMILGASILQLPAIQKAKELGYSVVAVDMDKNAVGFKEEGIEKEIISTIDIPNVVKAAKKHHINGIMTLASDMPMRTVAAVAKEMGLIGVSEETAMKATNKVEMRNALCENNVPIPLYFKASNENEFIAAVNKIHNKGYNVIAKPADNSGSRGIDLIDDYSMNNLKRIYEYTKKYSRSGDILAEEYMEGPEVSVETITYNGTYNVIQITDKLTTGAPYFVEMGHSQPSQLPENTKNKIKEITIAANKAIGIENGPSHTEIKITNDGPKIVELGARLGGDNITTHLVPLSTGVDMVEACIKISLDEKPDLKKKFNKASAIRYLKTGNGILKEINGLEKAKKTNGIMQVSLVKRTGDEINGIKSSSDRIGFVIAQGNTVGEAIMTCEKAIKRIKIRTS